MTWVDLVVLAVLAVSALLAFMRGLVHEVLGVGAWIGAVVVAIEGGPLVRPQVRHWIDDPVWADPLSYVAVFLVALILLSIVARVIGRMVRESALGGVDRSLGLVFGLARGAVVVMAAYVLGAMAIPMDQWPEAVTRARSLNPAYEGATWIVHRLPEQFRPNVKPPPEGRQATADSLLRATPQGRATGNR